MRYRDIGKFMLEGRMELERFDVLYSTIHSRASKDMRMKRPRVCSPYRFIINLTNSNPVLPKKLVSAPGLNTRRCDVFSIKAIRPIFLYTLVGMEQRQQALGNTKNTVLIINSLIQSVISLLSEMISLYPFKG